MRASGTLRRHLSPWVFLPWAGASALAWISVLPATAVDWWEYVLSTVLLLAVPALRAASANRRQDWSVAPALLFLVALALLRDSAGGSASGVSIVAFVPAFDLALRSRRLRPLVIYLAAMAVFFLAPVLIIGAPQYPSAQYRAALLTVTTAAIIGVTTHRLVLRARRDAEDAQRKGKMLEDLSHVVRDLYSSEDVRSAICEAARSIGDAVAAGLYEPTPGKNVLRATATAGFDAGQARISLDAPSALQQAYTSCSSLLLTEDVRQQVNVELWQSAGSPDSILYEPVMRAGECVGVLAVAWSGAVVADGPRATIVELLAHEVGSVIALGDAVSQLADDASNDPLTGLPNRRTWDRHLAHASHGKVPFTIAIFDLDHFKQYNDRYGHPAGDRLLKETASRWRDELRGGDLLARIGGEEFGLLLVDCARTEALEVIERLRAVIASGRTCSAGFAEGAPGETAQVVMARADGALYEAKNAGRDRALMSV